MRIYKCGGIEYECPDTACVFCVHCCDVFYDYTNGPYLILCDVPDHDCHGGAGCELFIDNKNCDNCKHFDLKLTEEPCYSCCFGGCDENINRTDRWEPK